MYRPFKSANEPDDMPAPPKGPPKRVGQLIALGVVLVLTLLPSRALAQDPYADQPREPLTYNYREIVDAGHRMFGQASIDLASAVEYVFESEGEPTGYIIGQEASGAIFGGLRYGEGQLRMKTGAVVPVFWQGPSVGFDVGADGSRIMMLVYNMDHPQQILERFTGASGLAYMAGGLGVHFHSSDQNVLLAVIRTGVGLRLGINVGYLKFTPEPTWNPF